MTPSRKLAVCVVAGLALVGCGAQREPADIADQREATVTTAPPTTVTTTTTTAPATTTTTELAVSEVAARGALVQAMAQLLPGYRISEADVPLFLERVTYRDDLNLAAVGFISERYAPTIAAEQRKAEDRELRRRLDCSVGVIGDMMSGTSVPRPQCD